MNAKDVSWNRSSYCGTGGCVEVARDGLTVLVRDSAAPTVGPIQIWEQWEWSSLIDAIRGDYQHAATWEDSFGLVVLGLPRHEGLTFLAGEWSDFVKGVKDGEFDFDGLLQAPAAGGSDSAAEGVAADQFYPAAAATQVEDSVTAATTPSSTHQTREGGVPALASPPSLVALDSPAGQGRPVAKLVEAARRAGQPGPTGPRQAARNAVVAAFEDAYGEPVVIESFRDVLHRYADAAVGAFLTAVWADAISPLVPISESSSTGDEEVVTVTARRPVTTDPGGIEGEVASEGASGATEPECRCSDLLADAACPTHGVAAFLGSTQDGTVR